MARVADDAGVGDDIALGVEVHVGGGGERRFLAVVDEDVFAGVLVDEHESAAADVAGKRVDDGEREADGDGSIDGVAAFLQDLNAGVGGEVMDGDDHGVRLAHGLIVPELESDLAGVVRGILRRLRGLRGQRQGHSEEKSGESDAGADSFAMRSHCDCHCMAEAGDGDEPTGQAGEKSWPSQGYSSRSATIGSTLLARHAGMTVAANATSASNAGTVRKVAKSLALTLNNRLAITRVRAAAHARPAKMPISASCIPCLHHQSENIFTPRPQRHQNPDIARALGHQIRHHSVQAHSSEQQRETRKCTQHGGGEALARERIEQTILHRSDSVDHHGRIDGVDLPDHGGGESCFIRGGAGHQECPPVGLLLHREIGRDFAVGLQTVLFDHSHHADNGDGFFRIEPEMLPDRVPVRPESLRELCVDDDDLLRVRAVLLGEKAARKQRNLHGPEIVRAGRALIHLQLLPWRRRISLHVDSAPSHRAGERERRNRAFGHDSWQVGDPGFDVTIETGQDLTSWYLLSLATICMVITWSVVNPGATSCRRTKLRISSPAPTSRISEKAISETTSKLRRR